MGEEKGEPDASQFLTYLLRAGLVDVDSECLQTVRSTLFEDAARFRACTPSVLPPPRMMPSSDIDAAQWSPPVPTMSMTSISVRDGLCVFTHCRCRPRDLVSCLHPAALRGKRREIGSILYSRRLARHDLIHDGVCFVISQVTAYRQFS